MAIKNIIFPLLLMLLCTGAAAQQKIRPLQIGDRLEDRSLEGVLNHKGGSGKLSALWKDGLLIIDFWATWCVPCIREMHELDSLKKLPGASFNALMVTGETPGLASAFLSRQGLELTSLVIVARDTLLRQLFPHRLIPHNVWIDRTGTVRAITGSEEVSAANIAHFLAGENIRATEKKDNLNFSALEEFHLGDSSFTYRSIISPNINGISGGMFIDLQQRMVKRAFQYNASIGQLYWSAYSGINGKLRRNLIEIHTADPTRFFNPGKNSGTVLEKSGYATMEEWIKKNTFCYALTLPRRVADTTFGKYMREDLDRHFDIHSEISPRNIRCTVVTRKKGSPVSPSTANPGQDKSIVSASGNRIIFTNCRIADVLDWAFRYFDADYLPLPFANSVPEHRDPPFDLTLDFAKGPADHSRPATVSYFKQELEKLGFVFAERMHSYPVLVLSDKK
ncbi:TlpA disulfide reductase family protein [Pedobacter miscanthi]|uniref:TlpA family protein disulfide reductase n=1 Tax=Pedobacter miscanthi TaxID=2259170 RepID=UPI00292E72EA|nr:TlpA disulfide reductase family protein [Pedobacter miscanthi]